jgi:outer membrane protein assembly factor BamB
MALDRRDGRVVWQRVAKEEAPHEASHQDNGTWASASPMTDGEHVIAPFESRGIFAYDMNGTLVWEKDLGDKSMRNEFGEGTTPALTATPSLSSGITRPARSSSRWTSAPAENWRVQRTDRQLGTPLVVERGTRPGRHSGMKRVRSYDLETGSCSGMATASP